MTTKEIADFLGATLIGDPDVDITSVAELAVAAQGQIAYVAKPDVEIHSLASCLIAPQELATATTIPLIEVDDPKLAFSKIAALLHPRRHRPAERHSSSVIAPTAVIGDGVFLGAFTCVGEHSSIGDGTQLRAGAKVGDNVAIGRNCVLHPNVLIDDNCTIGNNVVLHAGTVIGADGFGYVRDSGGYVKFPQIGKVIIEDDVEIGANSCVDRGALGETRIGLGTKIDNLVQIAHNVQIGKRVVIAAQTGISGSTVIEDDCVIGGQVGMGDHARVQSGAIIGSQAGILPGKIVRPGVWWGTPVQPLDEYKRQNAHVKGLGRLKEQLTDLKKRISELESEKK